MKPDWRAAIVVVRRGPNILSVAQGDDVNLPGGGREPDDATPEDTAKRELYEETGIIAKRLRPLASWMSKDPGGGLVIAYEATAFRGTLRSSPEGEAAWVRPARLFSPSSTYHRYHRQLLQR